MTAIWNVWPLGHFISVFPKLIAYWLVELLPRSRTSHKSTLWIDILMQCKNNNTIQCGVVFWLHFCIRPLNCPLLSVAALTMTKFVIPSPEQIGRGLLSCFCISFDLKLMPFDLIMSDFENGVNNDHLDTSYVIMWLWRWKNCNFKCKNRSFGRILAKKHKKMTVEGVFFLLNSETWLISAIYFTSDHKYGRNRSNVIII